MIHLKNWFAVCYPDNGKVIAVFEFEEWANDWRNKYSMTAIIRKADIDVAENDRQK